MAPSAYIEEDFKYLIPATEKPTMIVMTYRPFFGPKATVIVRLS
jgi:hypothetical protein